MDGRMDGWNDEWTGGGMGDDGRLGGWADGG